MKGKKEKNIEKWVTNRVFSLFLSHYMGENKLNK